MLIEERMKLCGWLSKISTSSGEIHTRTNLRLIHTTRTYVIIIKWDTSIALDDTTFRGPNADYAAQSAEFSNLVSGIEGINIILWIISKNF